jgi:hypothetical protein
VRFSLNKRGNKTSAKLREEVRRKVRRIEMHFGNDTCLPVCRIEFTNGAVRYVKLGERVKQADGWVETTMYLLGANIKTD